MKKKNRVAAMVLSVIMALSLAACGGAGGDSSDPLAAAQENMAKVTSMDATMTMEMDMEAGGESVETVTTMDMTVFSEPMRMKMDMSMDMGALGAVNMEVYAEEDEGGAYTMYLYDGSNWYAQAATESELDQYDFSGDISDYIESVSSFNQEGTEQVDGVSAYKYTGVISGSDMEKVMLSSGVLDSLSTTTSMDESQMAEMLSGLGDIAVTLYISEDGPYPIRYEMDMTAIMDGLMGKIVEAMGSEAGDMTMSISKTTLVLTYSNLNNATDFTIPEEARNAA